MHGHTLSENCGPVGLTIGIAVASLCVRVVKAQLYEITSVDTKVSVDAILMLAAAACIAGIIPARRAAIDPVQAFGME
jgi:macrolide transport system ATP-binding/permease protein